MTNDITYISADLLWPHPDNPRKSDSDLTELMESIKKNGILQNLTVVPDDETGEYRILIGHRRYAAGLEAGLKEFPCQIAEGLTLREQVAIMLEENMQRHDLTIQEQADGFQLMLDLGSTIEEIAQKTGFSETTVRHRVNIAKLDREALKKAESSWQVQLTDLYELEKIDDVSVRNEILNNATSSMHCAQLVQNEIVKLAIKNNTAEYVKLCEAAGIKPAPKSAKDEQYSDKWETVKKFDLTDPIAPEPGIPDPSDEALYYVVWWRALHIIKHSQKAELSEQEQARRDLNKRRDRIKSMWHAMVDEWRSFLQIIINKNSASKDPTTNAKTLLDIICANQGFINELSYTKILTPNGTLVGASDEEMMEYKTKRNKLSVEHRLIAHAIDSFAYKAPMMINGVYDKECGKQAIALEVVLEDYGFVYSSEDCLSISDGTHELYEK